MYEVLAPVERYGFVDDTYASVQAGGTSAAEFLDFADGFVNENDPDVWATLAQSLGQISRIVEDDVLDRFRARVRELVAPAQQRLGWEASDSDSERDLELRSLLIGALAITGDDSASQATAREMHDRYLENTSSIEPNVAAAIARVVAHQGGEADFERFVDRFNAPATPQEETRYMYALGSFPDAEQITRTLEMTLNGEIRTQNAPFVLAYCMMNRHHGILAWEFVKEHWEEINEKYPRNTIARLLTGVRALSKPDQAADVEAFFEDHDVPQGRLMLQQHLEKMRINVAFRERESGRLPEAI
jgi:puromycin-sensitive aminopeptidase